MSQNTKKTIFILSSLLLFLTSYTGAFASDQCYIDVNIGVHNATSTGIETYSFDGLDHYFGNYSDAVSINDPKWGACSLNTYDSSSTLLQKYSFIDSSLVFGEHYDEAINEIVGDIAVIPNSTTTVLIPADKQTKYLKLECGDNLINLTQLRPLDLECSKGISTCGELQNMELSPTANYVLKNDIDCSRISFKPISEDTPFSGSLNGNGHMIKGLNIDNANYNYDYIGLFGKLAGAVQNVKIIDSNINGHLYYGGATTGGIAGLQTEESTITDSSYSGYISSKWNTGGLVGESNGKIINSNSNGTVIAGWYSWPGFYLSVGGIAGIQGNTGTIDGSCSRAKVISNNGFPSDIRKTGQIVGESFGQVTNPCTSVSTVQNISTCQELQDIEKNPDLSYILTNDIDCSDTENWDDIQGFRPIASFLGKLDGNGYSINNLYINRPDKSFVGLFGDLTGTVINLGLENVDITGNSHVGAIAGRLINGGSLSTSYSTGNVKGSNVEEINDRWLIGGLVGQAWDGTISNSYSSANVTGYGAGGLVGTEVYASISNSYSVGTVSGNRVGGLAAYLDATVINSYYNSDTSTPTPPTLYDLVTKSFLKNVGKTTAELKSTSTYVGWDFANVWSINPDIKDGYPYLRIFSKANISITLSPLVARYDPSTHNATSTINWKIEGILKSCKAIEPGYMYDTRWLNKSISSSRGNHSTSTTLSGVDGSYGYSVVYGIECITENNKILDATSSLSVVY